MTCCVYQIRNVENGKVYIGSSKNFEQRKGQHLQRLRLGGHHSPALQNAWNVHGEATFVFEVLEPCTEEALCQVEQRWIDCTDSYRAGYNGRPIAESNRGQVISAVTRDKISVALKGRPKPEGFGGVIADRNRQRVLSDETKAKISTAHKGKKLSEEHRAKVVKNLDFSGHSHSEESKQLIREARAKQVITKEHVQKVADANRGKVRTEEQRKHISDALVGHVCSEETRRKISETKRARRLATSPDPEAR